jgi:hypothetical protein
MRQLSELGKSKNSKKFFPVFKFVAPCILILFVFLCSRLLVMAETYIMHCYPAIATTYSFKDRIV